MLNGSFAESLESSFDTAAQHYLQWVAQPGVNLLEASLSVLPWFSFGSGLSVRERLSWDMTNNVTRSQAEGLQFLGEYRSAFTSRADGSTWPKNERTWLNAGRYFRCLLRPGSPNTITDIADKMHTDQERLEGFVRESLLEHELVGAELRERLPEAIQGQEAGLIVYDMGIPKTGQDSIGVTR